MPKKSKWMRRDDRERRRRTGRRTSRKGLCPKCGAFLTGAERYTNFPDGIICEHRPRR